MQERKKDFEKDSHFSIDTAHVNKYKLNNISSRK